MSSEPQKGRQNLMAAISGLLFAVGLVTSGMTQPGKVIGFFDFGWSHEGSWDPSLAFVMLFGVLFYAPAYRIARRRQLPYFDDRFRLPTRRDIDLRLALGAAIFGLGWGLGGFCPGPGMTSLAPGAPGVFVFVFTMGVGMYTFSYWEKWRASRT